MKYKLQPEKTAANGTAGEFEGKSLRKLHVFLFIYLLLLVIALLKTRRISKTKKIHQK